MKKNRHLVLAVGYNGQKYSGSQYQQNAKTIEGELGKVLQAMNAMRDNESAPSFSKASRTDAGVSAVLALFGYFGIEIDDLVIKLNEALPEDIRVFGVQRQTPRFSPRQMCTGRQYTYYLPVSLLFCTQQSVLDALTKRRKDYRDFLEQKREEIIKHMAKPEQFVMEKLDFEPELKPAYCEMSPEAQVETFNKVFLEKLNQLANTSYVNRTGNYTFLSSLRDNTYSVANRKHVEFQFSEAKIVDGRAYTEITIAGQAFLYNQIRKMIGALCVIARGQAPSSWLGRALTGRHEFPTEVPMVPGEYLLLCKQLYKGYQGSQEYKLYGDLVIDTDPVKKLSEEFKTAQILPHIFSTKQQVNDEFTKYVDEQVEKVDMYELGQQAIAREIEIGKIVQANKTVIKITK